MELSEVQKRMAALMEKFNKTNSGSNVTVFTPADKAELDAIAAGVASLPAAS